MSVKLSEEEEAAFARINEKLGLGPDELTFTQADLDAKGKGPIILSSDPLESTIPPKAVAVASIADFRNKVYFDDPDDAHVDYPGAPAPKLLSLVKSAKSRRELKEEFTQDDIINLRKAATAYLLGKPEKVKDYEALINAFYFPGKIAVFTAGDITITKDNPLIINSGDPPVLNFKTMTIKPGGYIAVHEDSTINTQQFIKE